MQIPIHLLLLARTLVFDSRTSPTDTADRYQSYTFTRALDSIDAEMPIERLEGILDSMFSAYDNFLADVDKYPRFNDSLEAVICALTEQGMHAEHLGTVHVYTDVHAVKKYVRLACDEAGEVDRIDVDTEDCPPVCLLVDDMVDVCANVGLECMTFDERKRQLKVYLGKDEFARLSARVPEYDYMDDCA